MKYHIYLACFSFLISACQQQNESNTVVAKDQKNIIYILSDDHRHDFMGFTGKVPFLETPSMDRMAREGAHLKICQIAESYENSKHRLRALLTSDAPLFQYG